MDNNNTFTTLETKNFAMNVMNLSCSWLADIFVNHVVSASVKFRLGTTLLTEKKFEIFSCASCAPRQLSGHYLIKIRSLYVAVGMQQGTGVVEIQFLRSYSKLWTVSPFLRITDHWVMKKKQDLREDRVKIPLKATPRTGLWNKTCLCLD